jgi:hypothetical protein
MGHQSQQEAIQIAAAAAAAASSAITNNYLKNERRQPDGVSTNTTIKNTNQYQEREHEQEQSTSSPPPPPSRPKKGKKESPSSDKEQIELLDTLSVERERGITVKASTATMLYPHPSAIGPEGVLLINCIDCPGHSDFSSEVARSLTFVQGAVLLLDAAQGIQVTYDG